MSPTPTIIKTLDKNTDDLFPTFYFLLTAMATQYCNSSIFIGLDYFNKYFPNDHVKFIFPVAVVSAQFILTLLITKISHHVSFFNRIVFSLFFCATFLLIIPYEAAYLADTRLGFGIIMILIFALSFCAFGCAISLIGVASRISGKYTTYKLIGTGLGSIAVSCLREFTKLMFPEDHELGVLMVFLGGAFIALSIIVLHYKFTKSQFYQTYVENREQRLPDNVDDEEDNSPGIDSTPKRDLKTLIEVLKEIKLYPFLMGLTFVQMFMVFPGVMLSKPMPTMAEDTKIITLSFTFSISFIIGKKLAQFREYYNKNVVIAVILLRFILIAYFILQVVGTNIPIISTVWFAYVNVLMFGLTTGFPNCALYILAPEGVSKDKKEVAGFVTAIGLATGSLIGVFAALPFKNIRPGTL